MMKMMMKMKPFDLTTIFNEDRPMSWSAISSFEWNPKQWHDKYVLKKLPEITPELEFGSYVDKRIQTDAEFLPHVVRYPIMQHAMKGVFNGIPLIGFADAYRKQERILRPKGKHNMSVQPILNPALRDYKTGRKPWDQKRADQTGQLTLYAFFLWMMEKIKPEDVELYIDWLPTHVKDGKICFVEEDHTKLKPTTFRTKRTMRDMLKFGQRINTTWAAMQQYAQKEHGSVVHSLKDW